MPLSANDPSRKTWLDTPKNTDFPIQNIPFGVFLTRDDVITIGTRIGDYAIDLGALHQLGYFKGIPLTDDIFLQDTLNDFIADEKDLSNVIKYSAFFLISVNVDDSEEIRCSDLR